MTGGNAPQKPLIVFGLFKRAQALDKFFVGHYGGQYMHFAGPGTYVDGLVAWLPALILPLNN